MRLSDERLKADEKQKKLKASIIEGDKTIDPEALFGIWKDYPITLEEIRKKAWRKPVSIELEKPISPSSKTETMGRVYADIEMIATDDLVLVSYGHLEPAKIRRMDVHFLVDSGADYLTINENIKNQMNLRVLYTQTFEMADGSVVPCEIVGPVDLRFSNRECTCRAIVLPGQAEPLLGAIPMEDMDVIIHPKHQMLTVNPESPLIARHNLKGYRKH